MELHELVEARARFESLHDEELARPKVSGTSGVSLTKSELGIGAAFRGSTPNATDGLANTQLEGVLADILGDTTLQSHNEVDTFHEVAAVDEVRKFNTCAVLIITGKVTTGKIEDADAGAGIPISSNATDFLGIVATA